MVEQCTDKWRKQTYKGHPTVAYLTVTKQSVGIKPEQRPIRIARHSVDKVNGTSTLQRTEHHNDEHKCHNHRHVQAATQSAGRRKMSTHNEVVSDVMAESALENAAEMMPSTKGNITHTPSTPDDTSVGNRSSPRTGTGIPCDVQKR